MKTRVLFISAGEYVAQAKKWWFNKWKTIGHDGSRYILYDYPHDFRVTTCDAKWKAVKLGMDYENYIERYGVR
jgi:hypothetical protein